MITCGLMIIPVGEGEPAPVPLTGVSVKVKIIDLVAEVNIEQRYVNRENQPIEAVYKFPLDEGAAVCSFTAEVDGRTIQGVVKETEEAKTDYEEAIRSGHTAFLVEEKLPDVFKAKVGNLAAGSGAKIRITYITELKVEGGEIRFYLPTTIAPRYIPATDTSSVAADLASIKYTSHSNYTVDFEASVKMASAIKDIRSPTHKITLTNNGTNGVVKLDDIVTSMDRDLVLYIQVVEPHKARLLAEKSKGSSALMLSLVPSFKLQEQKVELIFVVDRSGSMQGAGIEQAKKALLLFLHSLPVDCYVNILGFGSTYHFLFPVSRKYGDEVLKITKEHTESLDANLGGTEIFAPLEALLAQRTVDGYLRQIFILTDGEVSNPDQVISLVRRQSGKARVFALGLGSSASHHLVEGIARAGNGTALFASLEERLEKKVMQQLQDALQPSLTNVKVSWDGYEEKENPPEVAVPVQTEPTLLGFGKPLESGAPAITEKKKEQKLRQAPCDGMIPPVFDGRHLVVYVLLQEGARVPQFVKLVADSPAGPLSVQVPLNNPSDSEEGLLLHRLAAKKLIQLLQDRLDDHENCKKEIIKLGCAYGLASRYTSYVAVDPKAQSDLKESWMMMKSRDVPVQVAHGWGGGFGGGAPPIGMMMKRSAAPMPMAMAYSSAPMMMMNSAPPMMMSLSSNAASRSRSSFAPQPPAPAAKRAMKSLSPVHLLERAAPAEMQMQCDDGDEDVAMSLGTEEDDGGHATMSFSDVDNSASSPTPPKILTDDDKLMKLVSIQSFDGAFKVDVILAQLLDTTLEDIKEAGRKVNCPENVWFTLVALSYMTVGLPKLQDSWILVVNKVEKWLRTQQIDDQDKAKQEAAQFVNSKLNT